MVNTTNQLIKKAYTFAADKHKDQKYGDEPYIVHPIQTYEVVTLLLPEDINLKCAALLHDVGEDQGVTKETLENEFNSDIADLVFQVTKDENKDFPITTFRGLALKVADNIANVSNGTTLTDPERRAKLFNKYASGFIHTGSNLKNWPKALEESR